MEETGELEPYKSVLDEDLDAMSASDSDEDESRKKKVGLSAYLEEKSSSTVTFYFLTIFEIVVLWKDFVPKLLCKQ